METMCVSRNAVWHGCLCVVIHLMKDEWMEDTDAGHNSIFLLNANSLSCLKKLKL